MERRTFINQVASLAIRAWREGSPLFPSVRLAQNLLETGGKLNAHNNLGGFKLGSGMPNEFWKGETYVTPTWEVIGGKRIETTATWRSYDSVYDFYRDQDLLFHRGRYERVRLAKTPQEQARMLQACGYATDPSYAAKINALINVYNLTKYDGDVEYEMKAADANAIINTYLKPAWKAAHDDGDKETAVEVGRLADELRKASGQPTQNS